MEACEGGSVGSAGSHFCFLIGGLGSLAACVLQVSISVSRYRMVLGGACSNLLVNLSPFGSGCTLKSITVSKSVALQNNGSNINPNTQPILIALTNPNTHSNNQSHTHAIT